MLERFRAAKQDEIGKLRSLEAKGQMSEPFKGARPSFIDALRADGLRAIAEYKRASPSRGNIELGISPEDCAEAYARGGASALSVLTEKVYFKGDISYLSAMARPNLPLLRKDFLFDPLQIQQTAATPASALLLIARMFESAEPLQKLVSMTEDYGMDAVVEVFDERDLKLARDAGATIVQVNNRNLDTLKTDLAICARLVQERSETEVWIAASGITSPAHADHVRTLGYDAMLVGTALMQGGRPEDTLRSLLS